MRNIPVVFVHRGNNKVDPAIQQAQCWNPRVVLLGDETNQETTAEFYLYQNFITSDAQQFRNSYQHMHTNPNIAHRLFACMRLFVVLAFMKQQQLSRVFHADSDVLLYTNVTDIAGSWGNYEILLATPAHQPRYRWAASTHVSYWSRRGLQLFCDFMLQSYDGVTLQLLKEKWNWHQQQRLPGGPCIMTLLYLFQLQYPKIVGNLLQPIGEIPHVFDLNINTAENSAPGEYTMCTTHDAPYGRYKQITWRDRQPYGYNIPQDCLVRFDGLHYQGGAKVELEPKESTNE